MALNTQTPSQRSFLLLRISYFEHKNNDLERGKINFPVGPQEPLLGTARDGRLHGSGMSHATRASPKPSFGAPGRMGDAVVGSGDSGWTTSKSGHPCPCRNCSQGPPEQRTGRGALLNRPSCPPDDPIIKGLNCSEQPRRSYQGDLLSGADPPLSKADAVSSVQD